MNMVFIHVMLCTDQLEKEGMGALWSICDKYGGWPLLGSQFKWNNTPDWIVLLADLHRLSCSAIFSLEVKQHPIILFQNIIYVCITKF
jgi:hypothetical protein